jgi:hypothetical protein
VLPARRSDRKGSINKRAAPSSWRAIGPIGGWLTTVSLSAARALGASALRCFKTYQAAMDDGLHGSSTAVRDGLTGGGISREPSCANLVRKRP